MIQTLANALADIRAGLAMRPLWIALAAEDIGDQHRRTTLGPLWLVFNYLAFALVFIFVFRRGNGDGLNYAAYVAVGLFIWFFIMETVTQSVTLFVREESYIQGTTLPLTVYVMRLTTQAVLRGGYTLAGCAAILLFSGIAVTPQWAWALVGLGIVIVTTPAAIIIVAFLGAYFPDSQFVISNLMRIGMFLTPVFWAPGSADTIRRVLYQWNPFTYFVEIVRSPIVYGGVPMLSLLLCASICLGLWLAALLALGRFRKQVVFVL